MNELEEIKNKIDIVEYVGKYVQLKQSGRNFKGLCPFHSEKTPSFMVSPEKQIWHCFGCNEGGDVISFVEKIEGLTFPEAVKELAAQAGVKLSQNFSERKEPTDKYYAINELACAYYEKALFKPEAKQALDYLKKRGLDDKTIKDFRLGFSPAQGEVVVKELTALGYTKEDLVKAGVANAKNGRVIDQFRNRLMFPITNVQGKTIGFSARVLDDTLPKYINTPETLIYHKSNILFGLDKAKEQARKQDHLVLVEGNMDMIFSYQAGVKNVAASSGTALTESQLDLIKRFTKNIKIAFDVDLAGQNATKRAIELAQDKGFNIKVIEVPEGKDPADLVKNDPDKWIKACKKAKYVVDYIFDSTFSKYDITNILDKKRATKELLGTISRLPDPVEKEHYLQILAQRIGISLQALTDALRKAKSTTNSKTKKTGALTEKVEEKKTKPISLEEHVMSLLFVAPNYADFFFNKLKPEDFVDPRLVSFAKDLNQLSIDRGEIDLEKWLKKQSKENQEYVNVLTLRIEDEFEEINDESLGEEIFSSVLRLRHNVYEEAKKKLIGQLQEAEKSGDKETLKKTMNELQSLIEQERNI
ncbi:MAG: DNA primase [Patescibacteria group bacterium]